MTNKITAMVPLSVVDLAPIAEGSDAAQSFRNTLALAQRAEAWGYRRFWIAEHHGLPGIASAATAVLVGFVAGGTSTLRVGAGGVMLPNHSPLVVAEQFGTLESLYPGRIDLGLGRAAGGDPAAARALRRNHLASIDAFPQDVVELADLFSDAPRQPVRAVPGTGLKVPLWILGSSLHGAKVAAALGLPFAFASHFAPAQMGEALALYRQRFKPSAQQAVPHAMLGFNVVAADTAEEAQYQATSLQQAFINLRSGRPSKLPPPVAGYGERLRPGERAVLDDVLRHSAVGSAADVRAALHAFIAMTDADEVIINSPVFDPAARLRSFEIVAEAAQDRRRPNRGLTRI